MFRAALLAFACVSALWAARWELAFFHDADNESLRLVDIALSSPERGIAVGILNRKGKERGVALVTADAGRNWARTELDDIPRSLFVLDDGAAWMVGERGVWFSEESGRSWRKLSSPDYVLRVAFSTRENGLAAGARKTALVTRDGGKTWKKIAELANVKSDPNLTVFEAASFDRPNTAIIVGSVRRRKPGEPPGPIWLDPDAERRVQEPRLAIFLQSADGGTTWRTQTTSVFGRIIDIAFSPGRAGLALFQFDRWFAFPSEVQCVDFPTSKVERCYANRKRALTGMTIGRDGAYLAGFEPSGAYAWSPVPGKVKILRSTDFKTWSESPVDYRAVATRVTIAATGGSAFAATDTGMILRLSD